MSQSLYCIAVAKMVHVFSECGDTLHVMFGYYDMNYRRYALESISGVHDWTSNLKILPEKLTFMTMMKETVSQEIMTKKNDSLLTCTTFSLFRILDYNSKLRFQLSYEYVFIAVFNQSSVNISYGVMSEFCWEFYLHTYCNR